MKKYLKIFLSLIMVFALTGCVKYTTSMEVGKDKSVTLEMVYAVDTSMMESLGGSDGEGIFDDEDEDVSTSETEEEPEEEETEGTEVNKEDYEWLEKKGYKVEEFEEEKDGSKYVGVKISKKFKSIDDMTKEKDTEVDFTKLFEDKENFDDSHIFAKKGSVYKANFIFDFTVDGEDVSDQYKDYQSYFDLKYTVKLPNKSKKNNATKVSDDGKTLTWNLKYGKKNEVQYEFEFGSALKDISSPKTILLIVVGIVAIAAIVAGVVLLKKKPKETN